LSKPRAAESRHSREYVDQVPAARVEAALGMQTDGRLVAMPAAIRQLATSLQQLVDLNIIRKNGRRSVSGLLDAMNVEVERLGLVGTRFRVSALEPRCMECDFPAEAATGCNGCAPAFCHRGGTRVRMRTTVISQDGGPVGCAVAIKATPVR